MTDGMFSLHQIVIKKDLQAMLIIPFYDDNNPKWCCLSHVRSLFFFLFWPNILYIRSFVAINIFPFLFVIISVLLYSFVCYQAVPRILIYIYNILSISIWHRSNTLWRYRNIYIVKGTIYIGFLQLYRKYRLLIFTRKSL